MPRLLLGKMSLMSIEDETFLLEEEQTSRPANDYKPSKHSLDPFQGNASLPPLNSTDFEHLIDLTYVIDNAALNKIHPDGSTRSSKTFNPPPKEN
jgi:hypothetical protein